MKQILTFTLLLFTFCTAAFAQSGNVVVSEIKLYDMGSGLGLVEVHVAGNFASPDMDAAIEMAGDRISSRSAVVRSVVSEGSGNQVMVTAQFSLLPAGPGNDNDEVNMLITLRPRLGNGLDYTYSRVGRIRPRRDI